MCFSADQDVNPKNSNSMRLARIITEQDHFQDEAVSLLVEMLALTKTDPPEQQLCCQQRCHITPVVFGVAHGMQSTATGQPPRGLHAAICINVAAVCHTIAGMLNTDK